MVSLTQSWFAAEVLSEFGSLIRLAKEAPVVLDGGPPHHVKSANVSPLDGHAAPVQSPLLFGATVLRSLSLWRRDRPGRFRRFGGGWQN
jgi:hypothetical protein